jgi:hypothetical protein
MPAYAFAFPILPGKADALRQFGNELLGSRKAEYDDLQRRLGVEEERYFLQQSPEGDLVIVAGSGGAAATSLAGVLAPDENAFDRWFVDRMQDLTGVDLRDLPSDPPELLGEWKP